MNDPDVYLDNNATTRPLPSVVEAMIPFLSENFANPSSGYPPAFAARRAIEEARSIVATFLQTRVPSQVVFTSGGTESIALALSSGASDYRQIVVSASEHSAVQAAAKRWSAGTPVCTVTVDRNGMLDLDELKRYVSVRPSLVSLTHANNETGVISDADAVARICHRHGATLHWDAIQSPGKIAVDVETLDCDYLSLSAHKFHGPKGVGILYARNPATLRALMPGHHESGMRSGTENVAGIVGAGAAVVALADWQGHVDHTARLRDRLESEVLTAIEDSAINGGAARRLCNTTNIYLPHRDAAQMVEELGRAGIYASAGAACSTGGEPSHVIQAMGYSRDRANSSLRFSLSRFTTDGEIDRAARAVRDVYSDSLPTFGMR